jgi:hypothetical protein
MPSATPQPPGPAHLALFGAEDLLRPDGCPVCRYVADAGDRFLGWFALEAHADAGMITRLCRSLGFCAVHTSGMLGQPGAEGRMTAVYTYLLRAAARYLAEGTSPAAPCLGCTRDAEATERALDTLLAGLREPDVRERYHAAHGLCLPHLRAAAARGGRRTAAWLAGDMLTRLSAGPPDLALLAGDAAPLPSVRSGPCHACVLAYRLERYALRNPGSPSAPVRGPSPPAALCPAHLRDACASPRAALSPAHLREACASPPAATVLAQETGRALAWLAATASPPARFAKLPSRSRRRGDGCPVCRSAGTPGDQAVRALHAAPDQPQMCLRHVLALRDRDPRGAEPVAASAADRTRALLAELEEASRKRSWQHRHEPRGHEMTAWRRAATLVDGRVSGFEPPIPR